MWSIVLFEALTLLRGSLHISCASFRNGVSLQSDPTTHNVEKWRIPVFISETFTTTGWFSHPVINMARQTSTGDYYSTVSEVCATVTSGKSSAPLLHEKVWVLWKQYIRSLSHRKIPNTACWQLSLEVVAGSPSPWVRPGHIDLLTDCRAGKGSIATYSGHAWQHHLNHMMEVDFTSIATWLL